MQKAFGGSAKKIGNETVAKQEAKNEAEWRCQMICLPFRHTARTASSLNQASSVTGTDFAEYFREKYWTGFAVG